MNERSKGDVPDSRGSWVGLDVGVENLKFKISKVTSKRSRETLLNRAFPKWTR